MSSVIAKFLIVELSDKSSNLFDLMPELHYAYDKSAIPPIIKEIETALVERVRISTDSSNKRKGAMLKKLPYRNTKNGLEAVTVETIEIAPRLEAVTFKNIPIGANIISPKTTSMKV